MSAPDTIKIANIVVVRMTDEQAIAQELKELGHTDIHCTNGTYSYAAERIVPTMLAGLQYINDKIAAHGDVFLIAVNSDVSMNAIMDQKQATQAERDALEDQYQRAMKVAMPLAEQFPDRVIAVVFYDKATPNDLYDTLAAEALNLETLHKWGYGTDPKAPKIEGAENFNRVLAYPLPNDVKPVCFGITAHADQADIIQVVKLSEVEGPHGKPYISAKGKVLFPVPVLLKEHAEDTAATAAPAPVPGAPRVS